MAMDNLSFSGEKSGWHDYPADQWDSRKPITWLPDWPFWKWCAETFSHNSPILELACGNGRITHQLVLDGYEVVAVDINPHFLNRALNTVSKTRFRENASFYLQDVVYLAIEHPPFHLAIMADWAFPSLIIQDDQRKFLTRLNQHLVEGGIFVFNTPFSTPQQLGLQPHPSGSGLYWPTDGRTFDPLAQVETRSSGTRELKFRHTSLEEIRLLAEITGFEIIDVYGGVDRRSLTGMPGDDLTLVFRKK